jgi:hypothetical protein
MNPQTRSKLTGTAAREPREPTDERAPALGRPGTSRESKPRHDDRPPSEDVQRERTKARRPDDEVTEQRRGESTDEKSGKKTGTGMPRYGDRETGDPRRSDVEGDGPAAKVESEA